MWQGSNAPAQRRCRSETLAACSEQNEEAIMSDSVKQVWRDLADQVGALGTTIQDRLRDAPAGDGEPGDRAEHDAALRSALDRLVEAGKELGERLGDVAHDDEVKRRAKAASASLDAALRATVELVSGKVQDLVRNERHDGPTDDSPPTA
jgi:hypothetical protein